MLQNSVILHFPVILQFSVISWTVIGHCHFCFEYMDFKFVIALGTCISQTHLAIKNELGVKGIHVAPTKFKPDRQNNSCVVLCCHQKNRSY